jgi:uncharacterized membrane-anchored protein
VAVLFTFALGTATGDLLAEFWKLGYAQLTLIFGAAIGIIAIPTERFAIAYYYFQSYFRTGLRCGVYHILLATLTF